MFWSISHDSGFKNNNFAPNCLWSKQKSLIVFHRLFIPWGVNDNFYEGIFLGIIPKNKRAAQHQISIIFF